MNRVKELHAKSHLIKHTLFFQDGDPGSTGDGAGTGAGEGGQQGTGTGEGQRQEGAQQNFEALRQEVANLKQQNELLSDQINLYRVNLPRGTSQEDPEKPKEDDLFAGLEEDDVMTVADVKKIVTKSIGSLQGQFKKGLSEVQMALSYPDYSQVIREHLPNVLKTNPALAQAIRTSDSPHLIAYVLARSDPEFVKKSTSDKQTNEAQRIIDNALQTGSASQAGGGGGAQGQAEFYANLSDDALEKRIAEVKGRV